MNSELTPKLIQAIQKGQMMAYRSFWDAGTAYLAEHWLVVTLILIALFVIASVNASLGQWGMLGSFLYRLIFVVIFLIIGFIWEPEIFASNYAKVGLVFVGVFCYWIVGRVLDWTGLRRRY